MVARSTAPIFTITFVMLQLPIVIILSLSVATTSGFIVTTTPTTTWTTKLSSRRLPTAKTEDDNNDCCSFNSNLRRYGRNRNSNPEIFRLRAAQKDPEQTGSEILRAEAESLKAKAEKLRSEIEENASQATKVTSGNKNNNVNADTNTNTNTNTAIATATTAPLSLPWDIVSTGPKEERDREFRLYCDIGREEGTWMDPRWGASGNRIEFSLDVGLLTNRLAAPEMSKKMIQDNTVGKSSRVFALDTAKFARLRGGFDRMECKGGAYRIDTSRSGRSTIRIVIEVEGTVKADQSYVYGDISIPAGCLYFSLPTFGSGINNLSIKDGMVSVRQVGWHTGWRREESRILGVFKAKSLSEAKKKDRF